LYTGLDGWTASKAFFTVNGEGSGIIISELSSLVVVFDAGEYE